jgi:hypothetical protein
MSAHSGTLSPAACHSSASVLAPALKVRWYSIRSSMTISSTGSQVCELDYVKVLAEFRRADVDAEAAYYGHRVMQTWVPALHAGPVTLPRPRSARWRWRGGWGCSWRTCIWPTAAVPPRRAPGARSEQPAPCRRVSGAGGPRVHWHVVLEVSTPRNPYPRPLRRKPRYPRQPRRRPGPPCPRPGLWRTTDVVDRRRIALLSSQGQAEQIDLPQPDRKDHQYDHG